MSDAIQLLLADAGRLQSMGRNFRHGGASASWSDLLLWGLGLLAVVVVASVVVHRISQRSKPGYTNPRRLFLELCKAHELDRRKRSLLWALARHQRLAHPSRLFLEPERFDAANLGPVLVESRAEIQRVRDVMFGKQLKQKGGR